MNALFGLPAILEAGRISVHIRTGAAFWIWATTKMHEGESVLHQALDDIFRDGEPVSLLTLNKEEVEAVFDRLSWFMRGGGEEGSPPQEPAKERLIDYEKDFDAIYAAFLQSYGVDLYADDNGTSLIQTMHWWRFLALVNNLPAGSTLVDYYMHYRGIDVSKIPHETKADKKYMDQVVKIKRRVALDGKRAEKTTPKVPGYVKRAQELKARGENV